jgi:hypothetical protein
VDDSLSQANFALILRCLGKSLQNLRQLVILSGFITACSGYKNSN